MIRILELDTNTPKHVQRFLNYPFQLYQDCPHWVSPAAQPATHTPPEQTCPVGQTLPHAPQLFAFELKSTQTLPQSESGAAQVNS